MLFVFPLYLVFGQSSRFNTFWLHVMYLPVALAAIIVQLIIVILLWPIGYIVGTGYLLVRVLRCRGNSGAGFRLLNFFIFLCLGWLILIFHSFVDMVIFIKQLYSHDLKMRQSKDAENDHNMEPQTLYLL